MARKGKKRRDDRRQTRDVSERPHDDASDSTQDRVERSSAPPQTQARQRPAQKRRARKAGHVQVGPFELPVRALIGWGAAAAAIAGVVVVVALIATSGSSGVTAPDAEFEPDPRVAGLTPVETLEIEAGGADVDAYFNPTQLTGPAGEAIEIVIENTGSLSHNLTIAGADGEYGTSDDWESEPLLIQPGGEGRLIVKLDDPGTYVFRCSLHPQVQTGELVLQ